MSTSNSKSATLTANTAASLAWDQRFSEAIVTNLTASPVYLTTDGTVVTSAGPGAEVVLPNATAQFANRGHKPVPSQSAAGVTSVSLISAAAGVVVVSPQ
jgi:hypothetical protein